ncbi:ABC transporter permease [Micromonospora sp. NPDC048170]|uniref:ABC transporter permease n=1 Tax=Micromonospora sp. NPDC048170 TaxID=3154819 RepID=UPI0033D9B7BE
MRSRIRFSDLLSESLSGVLQRPGRAVLTALGTLLGVGAFVAVLGLTASATGQISKRFTALAATEITVETVTEGGGARSVQSSAFPSDAVSRVLRIDGTVHAGVFWTLPNSRTGGATGLSLPGQAQSQQQVVAADPGMLLAANCRIAAGRLFDDFHDRNEQRVVVLGRAVAGRLGITNLSYQPAILIGDQPFTVMGIVDNVDRRPELLLSVIVPRRTAEALWPALPNEPTSQQMLIETRLGAAQMVAEQLPVAFDPAGQSQFKIIPPPDPRELRDGVNSDLSSLFLVLAMVCLAIGAVGIANTTLVAVLERVSEIGLRRALGARPRHIAAQFLAESATLGALGGLVGTSIGVVIVVAVSVVRHWTPLLEPWTVVSAPLIGTAVGLLAGVYPAVRASRIEPVAALQR